MARQRSASGAVPRRRCHRGRENLGPGRSSVWDDRSRPIAAGTVGASYYFFLQKKTEYYTDRDARLIARAANQVGRSVTIAAGILRNAAQLNDDELKTLYKVDGAVPDEQRMPSKIFKDIKKITPPDPSVKEERNHRYAVRDTNGLFVLNFDLVWDDKQEKEAKAAKEGKTPSKEASANTPAQKDPCAPPEPKDAKKK